jgi:hypothetical protein
MVRSLRKSKTIGQVVCRTDTVHTRHNSSIRRNSHPSHRDSQVNRVIHFLMDFSRHP